LSTPGALFKPIDANTLARLYSEDKIALETQVGHGLKSDGSLVLSVRAVVKKKVRNKIVRSYGELFHYNVTDLVAASGSINALQGSTPWTSTAGISAVLGSMNGNVSTTIGSAGQGFVLKIAGLSTGGAAGTRQVQINGLNISTKTLGASQGGFNDMLDREVAFAGGLALTVSGGAVQDTLIFSYVRIV
jgi:hypothetical protein